MISSLNRMRSGWNKPLNKLRSDSIKEVKERLKSNSSIKHEAKEMVEKCSICSKSFSKAPFCIKTKQTKVYFCSSEHMVLFIDLNFKNKSAEFFSTTEEISLEGKDVDPEYLNEDSKHGCVGAVTVNRKPKDEMENPE